MKIKSFNIELTTRCNAKCSLCKNQFAKTKDLSLLEIKKFFTRDVLCQLDSLKLYGSLGDPILHPEFKKIIKYFKECNPEISLNISTNGSMYNDLWWKNLCKILNKKDEIHFGIDGTEETHKIYRGTPFEKVFNNMKAFIRGGGNAKWLFLCFKHNQHQLEDLKKLSTFLGATFVPRYSGEYNEKFKAPDIKIIDSPVKEHFEPYCPLDECQLYLGADGIISPCPFLRIFCKGILEQGKGFGSEKEILIEFYKNKENLDYTKISFDFLKENKYLHWIIDNKPNFTNCKLCGFK